MRKYILSIVLILLGLSIVLINYSNRNTATYSETIFANKAQKFEQIFDAFSNQVKGHIFDLKNQFDNTLDIRDSTASRSYAISILEENKNLHSIGYFQGDNKLVARRKNNSYVVAIDSSSEFGVVKWHRFEAGKVVSSWHESIEASIYNSPWYKELTRDNDKLKWFLRSRVNLDSTDEDHDFFYAAYSYFHNGKQCAIVLEYSKNLLLKEFGFTADNIQPRLSLMDLDGKELLIKAEISVDSLETTTQIDSLQLHIEKHFANFKDVPRSTFNFNYNNQVYWNSFKRLSQESGLQYYLYTIPNSQLIVNSSSFIESYVSWIGLAFMLLGIIILLIRKRFFYRPNRMTIPSVSEILKEDENRYLEFKSSLRWDYRQEKVNPELEKVIMKTIAAFGNTDGGMLLIGVDDDKNILGLEKDFQTLKKTDQDYYEVHLRNILHKLMGVKYVSKYIRTEFEKVDDKVICKVKVISAKEPVYLKYNNKNGQQEEKFYVRSGNSSHEIKSIAEINDYINSKF